MSTIRPLTEKEKAWVTEEGINPDPMGVLYSNEQELHLRNDLTGSDMIVYWGLKHQREAGLLK